jgi:O-antigen/teichoic acid export membrane protein
VLIFGLLGFGVIGLAWSYTISLIFTLIITVYIFQKKVFPFLSSSIKAVNVSNELLTYSFPMLLSGVFGGVILSNMSITMIGYFKDAVEVGLYNAALPIAKILGIVTAPLTVLFLPVITELYANNKMQELGRVYKTTIKWIFFFNFPLLLLLLFYPHILINFLFGEDYSMGANAIIFLSLGSIIRGFSTIHGFILAMLKKTKIIFYISFSATFAAFFLNWFLIPRWGITGAAIASFLVFSIQYLLYFYFSYRFTKIMPFSYSLIKVVFTSFASFIIFYMISQLLLNLGYTKLILFFLLIGYLGLYSLFLLMSGALDKDDIEILRVIERRIGINSTPIKNIMKKFIR